MDFNPNMRAALAAEYESDQLEVGELVGLAMRLSASAKDLRLLLEDASESEPGATPEERLQSLLARGRRSGGINLKQVVEFGQGLGLSDPYINGTLSVLLNHSIAAVTRR